MEHLSFVSLSPWTIVIQTVNLIILTLILKRFLFRPVQGILQRRSNEVEDAYEDAGRKNRHAEALRREYERKISDALFETEEMKQCAEREIETMYAEAMDRAKGEAAHIRENANREMEKERRHAEKQLREQASGLAVEIAEKILGRAIDRDDQLRLMEEFIENVEIKK